MEHLIDLSGCPGTPILVGVGGSHAYGMAHAESDVDYRGCYVAPTRSFFGLYKPKETFDGHEPVDFALHEVGKLLMLAAKGNPTVLELFFYSEYAVRTDLGNLLIQNRDLFITERIRGSHIGYANEQFARLKRREGTFSSDTAKRTEKHARHIIRLVQLAERALTTGVFDIVVPNRDEIFAFGKLPYEELIVQAEAEIERVHAVPSVLPPEPDMTGINDLLVYIRERDLLRA